MSGSSVTEEKEKKEEKKEKEKKAVFSSVFSVSGMPLG